MSDMVQLHFKYTEEEWAAASRLYIMRQPKLLLRFVTAFIMLAISFAFFAAISEVVLSLFMLSVGLILFTFVVSLFFILPRQRFRSDPRHRDEFFLEFTEDGIRFQTERIDSRLDWSLYSGVLENDRFYVLIYGKGMMSVVPKRAFTTHDQEMTFRNLLRRKFGHTSTSHFLRELSSKELERAYVPPAEPPDWR
jgi:hypothetical protein